MTVVAYVSCADSAEIAVLRLRSDGTLEPVQTVAVSGAVMPLAVAPDRRHLYASLRSQPWSVACFEIDSGTGELRARETVPLPGNMAYLSTDHGGRYLLGASYTGDFVSVNAIDADGGVVAEPIEALATPPHAHSIVTDPTDRHVFVAALGGDVVLQFRFDARTGRGVPNDPAFVSTKPGAGPRHLLFHPNGRLVYGTNELDGTVSGYEYDSGTGRLSPLDTVSVLPEPGGEPWTAELKLTPDGRLLYVSERRSSTIAGFRVDPGTGVLTPLGHTVTESCPRGMAIDPSGRNLLAAGQESHAVTSYAIDPDSGALRPVDRRRVGWNPNWVELVTI
ncbi:beta-propeller fold lactonase family protein [Nocardia sp. ET3-3]|uniref:Beta-propeller fold lactonase family protein n=1 Tax=Nocardia terrae TaxID=2675851 RepID=A0A7K1V188_9NOCA|nr:beta-propeller fold lactonase family protein [Nocardia terrae]MVU80291.1 beta-propeller fold lactonase family protein [Nocardia terrae]